MLQSSSHLSRPMPRIQCAPENLLEWAAGRLNLIPAPMVETLSAAVVARSIMVAARLGVFEVLSESPLTSQQVADQIDAHPGAVQKLLNLLAASGYLRYREVFSVAGRRAQECRDPATLPPANIPTIGGAFQQLGSAMGG